MSEKMYHLIDYKLLKKDIKNILPAGLILLVVFSTFHYFFGGGCPSIIIAGLPCPGCGLTRATMAFLSFDFIRAWNYNPFIYLIIALGCLAFYFRYIKRKIFPYFTTISIVIVLLMITYFVVRMVLYFPHEEPMTYKSDNLIRRFIELY